MKNMENNGLLKLEDFACYIITLYKEKYGKDISPIKLQKALYFCFAFWGGFVNKSKTSEEPIDLSPVLFDATFQAWSYGPVIPKIYHDFQEGKLSKNISEEELFGENEILKETINSLLNDIFEISDFKLVNISHEDNAWKNHYDFKSSQHNGVIDGNEIIKEYTFK